MEHFNNALAAGVAALESETTRWQAGRIGDQGDGTHAEHTVGGAQRPACPPRDDCERKCEATLIARAALAGVTVLGSRDDRGRPEWIATKWHLTRAFASLDELDGWLDRIGGRT